MRCQESNGDVVLGEAVKCQVRDEGLWPNLLAVPANADKTVALQPTGIQAGI